MVITLPKYINGFVEDRANKLQAAGIASAGASPYAAAADHVHPTQSLSDLGAAEISHTHSKNQITDLSVLNLVPPPESAAESGAVGDVAFDTGYVYLCVAEDTWLRAAIETWA